jgi:hypothetical protein
MSDKKKTVYAALKKFRTLLTATKATKQKP